MRRGNIRNKRMKNILSNQKGMALLTTLIFVFLLVTLGVALLTMTNNDIKLSTLQRDSTKAFYLADSGIQRSIKELKDDPDWPGFDEPQNLGDGTYNVVIEDKDDDPTIPSNQVWVTSTGTVLNSKRKMKIFVKSEGISPIFEYVIASKTDLRFVGSSPRITGDIYSGEDITIVGSPYIDGDVNAVGTYTSVGSPIITGGIYRGVAEEMFPIIDVEYYKAQAQKEGTEGTYEGDYIIIGSVSKTLGPLYINGDLRVTGSANITLEGTVYVTGEVRFTGSGSVNGLGNIICENNMQIVGSPTLTPENMPVFMSTTGNISVVGSAVMLQLVAYAPEGKIGFVGSPNVCGALVGKEYIGVGNSNITLYPNLDDLHLNLPSGPLSIVSWQEIY